MKNEALFSENMSLVHEVINRYFKWACGSTVMLDYEDLFQVGCMALMSAAESYDESRAGKFSTYAFTCIKNRVGDYLEKETKRKPINSKMPEWAPEKGKEETAYDAILMEFEIEKIVGSLENREKAEKALSAVHLKIKGYTLAEIAEMLGYKDKQQAQRAIAWFKSACAEKYAG